MADNTIKKLACISLLLCSVLPAITAGGLKAFDPAVIMKYPSNSSFIHFGGGLQPNHLLMFDWEKTYDPFPVLKCNVFTLDRYNCNVNLNVSTGSVSALVSSMYQLAEEKVIITWYEVSKKFINLGIQCSNCGLVKKITTLDVRTCATANTFSYPAELGWVDVLYYKDGFDVVRVPVNGTSSRSSYDLDGNSIDYPQPFPRITKFRATAEKSFGFFAQPVSRDSRSGKIVVFSNDGNDKNDISIDLVSASGEYDKKLATFKEPLSRIDRADIENVVISNVDQSFTTACWVADSTSIEITGKWSVKKIIRCVQFDKFGNEKYKDIMTTMKGEYLVDVRNLREGGVVLFSFSEGKELHVTEMRLGRKVEETSYPLSNDAVQVQILDVNEIDRSFNYVCANAGTSRNVSMYSHFLPSKIH